MESYFFYGTVSCAVAWLNPLLKQRTQENERAKREEEQGGGPAASRAAPPFPALPRARPKRSAIDKAPDEMARYAAKRRMELREANNWRWKASRHVGWRNCDICHGGGSRCIRCVRCERLACTRNCQHWEVPHGSRDGRQVGFLLCAQCHETHGVAPFVPPTVVGLAGRPDVPGVVPRRPQLPAAPNRHLPVVPACALHRAPDVAAAVPVRRALPRRPRD